MLKHHFQETCRDNLVVCEFLCEDAWLKTYCWSIGTELATSSAGTQAWWSSAHAHQGHHSLLVCRNSKQHFSTVLEGHFKQQDHQQKAQKMWSEEHIEKVFLYSLRAGTGRSKVALVWPWLRTRASGGSKSSRFCACPPVTVTSLGAWSWELQKNVIKQENLQIRNLNNEDRLNLM